ncbi:2,3-dihydro-2,3-dihydroxybenzoate dehydrogenase [Marinactinospora thermotolerans]|nr:2,3-dihydro-2,3-dihydroxybenzoate dehydrogenase [Marinactinospora thermotolerans]
MGEQVEEPGARQVALVTGACGGIGAAVVRGLVARGAAVAALDRDGHGVRELAASLAEEGAEVLPFSVDVADRVAVEEAVARAEAQAGPLTSAVNVAGILSPGSALEPAEDAWRTAFEVNTLGVVNVSTAVARRMVPRRSGAIVTVGSDAARIARIDMAAYAATKAAAARFTMCLGLELAPHGVRCNVVSPGSTDTPMRRLLWGDDGGAGSVAGAPERFRVGIPLGRIADPADIAAAVLFLLSPQARHITMHDLHVDGGVGLGL